MRKHSTTKRLLSALVAVLFAMTMLGAFPVFAAPQFGGFGDLTDTSVATDGNGSTGTTTPQFGGFDVESDNAGAKDKEDKEDTEAPDFGGFDVESDNAAGTKSSLILNAPEGTDLGGLKVSAYQVLAESTDANGYKEYLVTPDFVDFFNRYGDKGYSKLDTGNAAYVYVTYNETKNQLEYSTTRPAGQCILLSAKDLADIDMNFFEAELLSRILGEGKNGVTTNTGNAQLISEWLRLYVKNKPIHTKITKTAKPGDSQVKFSGVLDDGYWFVLSENAPVGVANVKSVLKTTNGQVYTMDLKAEYPKLEKTVENDGVSYDDGKSTTASVGDILDYDITFEMQDMSYYTKGGYTFKIHDKMTNQKLSPSYLEEDTKEKYPYIFSVTFKEYGQIVTFVDLNRDQLEELDVLGDYYPLSMILKKNIEADEFTLDFDVAKLQQLWTNNLVEAKFGDNVTMSVKYKAELTSDAVMRNGNEVDIEYSNDPNVPDQTVEDKDEGTTVYSYGLDLYKKFSDDKGNFKDVTFNLFKADFSGLYDGSGFDKFLGGSASGNTGAPIVAKDGDAIEFVKVDGIFVKADSDDKKTDTLLTLDDDGNLKVYGLAPGYYILEELTTTNGYKIAEQIVLYIAEDGTVSHGLTVKGNDPSLVYEGGTSLKPGVKVEKDDNGDDRNYITFELLNQKGWELPGTGGMGILLFGIGGVLLIAAAAYLFVSQKKRNQA